MKQIQEFIASLEQYESVGYDKKATSMNLMFYPNISQAKRKSLKRWNILFFTDNPSGISYGLKITPNLPFDKWPVYRLFDEHNGGLYCPTKEDLMAHTVFRQLKYEQISEYPLPDVFYGEEGEALLEIFGGREKRDMVIERFEPMFGEEEQMLRQKEIELLLQLDSSTSHQIYRTAYQKLIDEKDYLPIDALDKVEFPYRDRLLKSTAVKIATTREMALNLDLEKFNLLWEAYSTTIHGLDMDRPSFCQGLSIDIASASRMPHLVRVLTLSQQSNTIKSHPLYDSAVTFRKSIRYGGLQHAIGAALLDEQYNDPIGSFNALATGSYWAAQQGRSDVQFYTKAALAVCEENNWHDAAYAIEYQIRKFEDANKS